MSATRHGAGRSQGGPGRRPTASEGTDRPCRPLARRALLRIAGGLALASLPSAVALALEASPARILAANLVLGLPAVVPGLLLVVSGARDARSELLLRRLGAEHPRETWLGDRLWDPAGARDVARRRGLQFLGAVLLAILVTAAITAVPLYGILTGTARGPWDSLWAVVALVALPGLVGAFGFAARTAWRTSPRRPSLAFARFPFFLGDVLEAELVRPPGAPPRELRVRLSCVVEAEILLSENDDQVTTVHEPVWSTGMRIPAASAASPRVPIRIPLPPRPELATLFACEKPRYWELEVRSPDAAVPEATFIVPVYARPTGLDGTADEGRGARSRRG